MDKHARLPFLGLLKVSLLGVAFPLLLTSNSWAQANIKQDNSLLYAQTPAQSTPQPSKSGEVKKTNPPPQEKQKEEGEKSDEEKKQDLPWFVPPIGLGLLVALYVGVLWFRPLWLLWLPAELKIPKMGIIPQFNLPLGFVIWLKYHPKVLDAWVMKYIDTWRDNFNKNETVSRHEKYVSLAVNFLDRNQKKHKNQYQQQKLIAKDLRKIVTKDNRLRILIWGDGGTGKTTIACQIAKWAMADDKEERLTKHLMLPVLIDQELKSLSDKDTENLVKNIMSKMQELINTKDDIKDELLIKQLLRERRILLIVDRFSEMNSDTRKKIGPTQGEFPANAFVVTSRIDEREIGEIDIKIKTLTLDGVDFTTFIKQYLKTVNKWEPFDKNQENFLKECAKLVATFGFKKTIIPLFAQLHAVRMINTQDSTERSPDNIPDLIVEHLKTLNSHVQRSIENQEFHTWEENAKLIAWKCLEQKYKPEYVARKSIVAALGEEKGDEILKYFEEKLHLIKSGESGTIRFTLDTLAEYLAGLYLVEFHKEDKQSWDNFLQKIESNPDKNQEIKGFLLAVRECCITKGGEQTRSYVADKLGELAKVDLEAEKQEKQRQRIDRFISDLSDSDLELQSKQAAVKELQKMAATDQYALDGLLIALEIDNITVRGDATTALGNLRNTSKPVLDGLLARLEDRDDDDNVRSNVVVALGKLGNASKQVLNGLLARLEDLDEYALHYNAVVALGNLGNNSKPVIDQLLVCLQYNKDYNVDVRKAAAERLGKLGNDSKSVLDGLLARLQDRDDDVDVRQAVIAALSNLGNDSKPVLDGLLARLEDRDDDVDVRQAVIAALSNLGNDSKPVLDGLLARLQDRDDDVDVRQAVIAALSNLGNDSKPVLDGLLARLQDKNDNVFVRRDATAALGKLGNASQQVVDRLLGRLQDKNDEPNVRRNTAEALGKLGNASQQVVDGLLGCLQDKNDEPNVRRDATAALGKLGNASQQVVDGLSARSKDTKENSEVRDAATKALESLKKIE